MWTRVNEFDRMFRTMDMLQSLFHNYGLYRPTALRGGVAEVGPRTNMYDVGDRLEVRVEVPGIAKDNLSIKIQGSYLEISGTRKTDTPEGYKAHRIERGETSFTRSFTLPSDVESAGVEAALKDGILTLRLPKVEKAKPIQIAIG